MNNYKPDHTDLCILNYSQEDCRLSVKELSAKMRMSSTAISQRLHRLRKEEFIKSYTTVLNREKLNRRLIVFAQIQLFDHSAIHVQQFMDEVNQWDEVKECYHTTGLYDFHLKIAVRNTKEYNILLIEKLSNIPNLRHLESYFIINELKFDTSLKLELS